MVIKCKEMQKMAGRNASRVDTSALKLQIERKLGHERSQKYFNLLGRYFCRKINKYAFSKLCICLIGRENLRLHNLLIHAFVKNSLGKTPPPKEKEKDIKVPNGYQTSLETLCRDAFPRKERTQNTRDRKLKDRPSPLGTHARTQIVVCKDSISIPKVQEQQSEVNSVEDGEEVEQASGSSSISRSPVMPPFGFSIRGKEPRKVLPNGSTFSSLVGSCFSSGVLPDNRSLVTLLENKLEMEGLKITKDCVSLLNCSLDVYLKRLIAPCVELAGSRCVDNSSDEVHKHVIFGLNGLTPMRYVQKQSGPVSASLLDFRVAMESNPSRLGDDWPQQLEKRSSFPCGPKSSSIHFRTSSS